jgi:chromosome segregation ATPase
MMKRTSIYLSTFLGLLILLFSLSSAHAKFDINLKDHKRLGGHTIERHVGRSDAQLIARLKKEKDISASSSFPNLGAAEKAIEGILNRVEKKVRDWADEAPRGDREVYEGKGKGRGITRKDYNKAIKKAKKANGKIVKAIEDAETLIEEKEKIKDKKDAKYKKLNKEGKAAVSEFKKDKQNIEKKQKMIKVQKSIKIAAKDLKQAKRAVKSAQDGLKKAKKDLLKAADQGIQDAVKPLKKAQVVIQANGAGGFFILTAFPMN